MLFADIIKAADLGWLVTNNDQQSYIISTTFANVWTRAFRPMVDIFSILREL